MIQIIFLAICLITSTIYAILSKEKSIKLIVLSIVTSIPMTILFKVTTTNIVLSTIISILYVCAYHDVKHHKIENVAIILVSILSILTSTNIKTSIVQTIIISIVFIVAIALNLLNSLGGGDIKLLCSLSLLLNFKEYYLMLIITLTSTIIGYISIRIFYHFKDTNRTSIKSNAIPLGPYILIGTYATILICRL